MTDLRLALATVRAVDPVDREGLVRLIHEPSLPDVCLGLLLCDWASSLLQRETQEGRPPLPGSVRGVEIKRLWLADACDRDEMEDACAQARRAWLECRERVGVGASLIQPVEDAFARAVQRFLDDSQRRVRAAHAAYLASRFAVQHSDLSAERNAFYSLLTHLSEPSWWPALHQRLLALLEAFQEQRRALVVLLQRRQQQRRDEAKRWKALLEDSLYE